MDSPNPSPSPGDRSGPNVYQISGVPVEFPYKPYGSQLAFMGRIISTLERARRQGRCHALLESPTGTGKSLSLLCSSLAWQEHQRHRGQSAPLAAAAGESTQPPTPDLFVHGGGFIPEPEPSMNTEHPRAATSARAQRKQLMPTIFYSSRTHSQISQVIREYRKTSYRVPMAILASRKHYCTNKYVCTRENVDEECKKLLKDETLGCSEFKNAKKIRSHPTFQKGGCNEVHDIEDLVKIGQKVKGCPYFAAQSMAEDAQLVFCPYSYIINPIVRRAMDLDIKDSILILDEAHNIEDIARDAASLEVEEEVLDVLQTELGQLCTGESGASVYQPLYDMIQGIISWIDNRKLSLQKSDFEHYSSYWTAEKATRELQLAGISQQCFPILQECATKAIKAASDAEFVGDHLSGISAITLEGLFSSLSYFFSGNGCQAIDYQLALQRHVKRDGDNSANGGWVCKLSLWCLNPAVVFREISNLSLSIILTSGTLSPMGSLTSELGVKFDTCMEAPHVIDVKSQLFAAVIPYGPANCQLNASYKTADGYNFQDGVGAALEEIFKIAPGGILIFFPSYKLLEKLNTRWCQTGQWSRLNALKLVFVEPRGTDEFEPVLKGYYNAIRGGTMKSAHGKSRLGLKRVSKNSTMNDCPQDPVKCGAAFFAVCRGKVSEGIDFSDDNARVVVIVGIPFPNINDIQVVLKKKYNDMYRSSKGLLSGSEWYCHQAFRALNQAAGRCIRHRFDYGAILLLDERFKENRNLTYISKWLKNSIKQFNSFDESLAGLKDFFGNIEKQLCPRSDNSICKEQIEIESLCSDGKKEHISSKPNLNQGMQSKRNQKVNRLNHEKVGKIANENGLAASKTTKSTKHSNLEVLKDSPLSSSKNHCTRRGKAAGEKNLTSLNRSENNVGIENSYQFQMQIKSSERLPILSSDSNLHNPLIIEDSFVSDHIGIPREVPEVKHASRTLAPCNQLIQRFSFSLSTTQSNENLSEGACTSATTPERLEIANLSDDEKESSFNMSVNSHSRKRRKLFNWQMSGCTQMEQFSFPDAESFCQTDCVNSKIMREADETSESLFQDNYSASEHEIPIQETPTKDCSGTLSSDLSTEKKLEISCLLCKSPLGLHERENLVSCSLMSSSKDYLAYLLKHGPPVTSYLNYPSDICQTNVRIVICDKSSLDHRIFNTCRKQTAPPHDVWSEEDGCVFRIVTCPFCNASSTCLGVQIIATDASNIHLLNKVLFYADYLHIKNEQRPNQEITMPASANSRGQVPASPEIEKYAYNSYTKNNVLLSRKRSKLSLPKRE